MAILNICITFEFHTSFGHFLTESNMQGATRVHSKILRRKTARRVIYSSDEETRSQDAMDTPCGSSPHNTKDGGSSMHQAKTSGKSKVTPVSPEQGTVIEFLHNDGNDSPWESDLDSSGSESSTPDFKRGKHAQQPPVQTQQSQDSEDKNMSGKRQVLSDQQVIELIKTEGIAYSLPKWINERRVRGSVLILADAQLKDWPLKDGICSVTLRQNWPINRWNLAIKTGIIPVSHHRVIVLYLENSRAWDEIPPIKNALQRLCKVIRQMAGNPRIYISNHLPRAVSSPLRNPIVMSNFILQQATRSVSRALRGGVFELSLHEHFTSSRSGRPLAPKHKYFAETGHLT